MEEIKLIEGNDNVFEDLGFDREEAANLRLEPTTIRTRLSAICLKLAYPPKPAFLQPYTEERPIKGHRAGPRN